MLVMWDEIGEAEDNRQAGDAAVVGVPQRVPDQGRAGPTPSGAAQEGRHR
jgi:hypothetical protein